MDNTKLIARAISWLRADDKFPRVDANDMVQELAVALEAAEAELTRRDTVIANALAAIECVPLMDDRYGTHVDRKVLFDILAAAPVSLEAVKAETTTAWAETTEYAYGHLDAPDTIVATGEDIDDRGSAECNAEEFWAQVLERTVRRSEWRPVSTEGGDRV